jgi:hypothetical protein
MDRGWMNVFRRWVNTDAVRRYWPAFRPEFTPDFVNFCETQLHLTAAPPALIPVPANYRTDPARGFERDSIETLTEEFAREWPAMVTPEPYPGLPGARFPKRGLAERIDEALAMPANPLLMWLAVEAPAGHGPADQAPDGERFPGGIFLIGPDVVIDRNAETATAMSPLGVYELFAWIRRPRRSQELGSQLLETVLDEAKQKLAGKKLRVRYPKSGKASDTDQELRMWMSFFALYNFKPVSGREGAIESVMELTL